MLSRVDWRRDLHFQTRTTIDTLDYSGTGFNQGSKVVIAAVGQPTRELPAELPSDLRLPEGFSAPAVATPGILLVQCEQRGLGDRVRIQQGFCDLINAGESINSFPLVVIVDDSDFAARTIDNFLWTTFTRSNPATDVYGIGAEIVDKHWGCSGSLVIDARVKPHHAPPLVEDPEIMKRVDAIAARGGPLARYL